MPFITEELWTALHREAPPAVSIALATFPEPDATAADSEAEAAVGALQAAVTDARQSPARLPEYLEDAALAWARAGGAETAFLQVLAANAAASRLYERMGFSERYRYVHAAFE